MEQKNASYANDMFAVEKNGLSLKHYDECIEEAGYTMHKAAQYVSCTPQTPGNQGILVIVSMWSMSYGPFIWFISYALAYDHFYIKVSHLHFGCSSTTSLFKHQMKTPESVQPSLQITF